MSRKMLRVETKHQAWIHAPEPDPETDLFAEVFEPDTQGDEAWMDAVAEHSSMQIRAYERSSK